MRLLIIEDSPAIQKSLRSGLKDFYTIDSSMNGAEGLKMAQKTMYDVILLDLNLPDLSGENVCTKLRAQGLQMPIIVISGRDNVEDKINLLGSGADDYMTKPFNINELRARIDVALRHSSNRGIGTVVSVEGLELDTASRVVKRENTQIILRRKEFDLLEYLIRNKNKTLTRSMILEHVWNTTSDLGVNVVDVNIKYLRDKIDRPFENKVIKTVHGVGYKLDVSQAHGN